MKRELKVVSLFSGIGGFEAGLKKSKLKTKIVFSSEIDEKAKISYSMNFKNNNLHGDITKIDENDIPDHDILVAGFPCQSFSIAGKQGGFDDTRGTLFFDVCRIIKAKNTPVVFLENVKNLVSHDKSKTISVILSHLSKLGYIVDFDILNSCDFGVPQSRERTYIIALKSDLFFNINEKYNMSSTSKKINNLKHELNIMKYPSMNFFDKVKRSPKYSYIEDIINKEQMDDKYLISNNKVQEYLEYNKIEDTNLKNNHSILKLFDLPKDVWNDLERQRRVYSIKGISPTVLARSDSTKILIHSKNSIFIRKFTPEENFKAMGFDNKFIRNILNGNMSNTNLYKQSGNAVCPPVITAISNTINDFLDNNLIKVNNHNNNTSKSCKTNFIDLFCGLGGFRIALESQGMNCVFSCDIDQPVREVYYQNFKEHPSGDITKVNPKTIPDFDVLCAGFPCQPFSLAGKRLGFEDTRGTLFFEVARIAKEKQPKFLLLENVAGLANHDKGNTLEVIKNTINSIGYVFYYEIINAYDYGIPQNRKRWYGVAIRKDVKKSMDKKNIVFKFPNKIKLKYTLSDIIERDVSKEYNVTETCRKNIKKYINAYKESSRYNNKNYIIATEVRPSRCNFRSDNISPCLTAKMGTGGNNVPVLVDYNRKLTEKECLKIMGFPDWYNIPKNKMQSYKQIGNSVVVPIIEMFAAEIKRILEETDND